MSDVLRVLFFIGLVAGIVTLGKLADRAGGGRRRSWLVAAWNASGARPLKAQTLGVAFAELAGRGVGGAARRGRRAAAWSGRHLGRGVRAGWRRTGGRLLPQAAEGTVRAAERRWEHRAGHVPRTLWWRVPRPQDTSKRRRWWRRETESETKPETEQPETTVPDIEQPEIPRVPRLVPRRDDLHAGRRADDDTGPGDDQAAPGGQVALPPDWAIIVGRVSQLEPGSDEQLIRFMTGELAGMLSYANAMLTLHETCVSSIGLDPSAVQGVAEFASATGEASRVMAGAHQRFLAVYQEVRQMVAKGVIMPFKGRWFSGQS